MLKSMLKRRKQLEEQKADLNLNDSGPDMGRREGGNTRQLRKRGREAINGGVSEAMVASSPTVPEPPVSNKRTVVPEVRVTLSDDEVDADFHSILRMRPPHSARQAATNDGN